MPKRVLKTESTSTDVVVKKAKVKTENISENVKSSKFQKKSKPLGKPGKPDFKKKNGAVNGTKSNNFPPKTEKPEDWNEFKKKKKEVTLKRKQKRTGFDVIIQAKKIGEKLRCKTLKGGEEERNKLINEIHSMLKGQKLYEKLVLAHDTSRIVQWLLKYSSPVVKEQISTELIPSTVGMLQSKYAIHCVKRLLKYGNPKTKSSIIDKLYGNAVKFTSHTLSAPVVEYAYTTWATPLQKQHLTQEFYGEMYRKSKDDKVKHLRDVYAQSNDIKSATLSATKANVLRIINKNLLDSSLIQTVINQFLSECSAEDRSEIITLLVPSLVVISNSKDGSRAAMKCIWYGSNKDRKSAIKILKEHVVDLSKHEHGHCTVITVLDAADDTVFLKKVIIGDILKNARDLAVTDWGRKVLLWLIAPGEPTCFHPVFMKELEEGRAASTSKKDPEIRRSEILGYSLETLLGLVAEDAGFWLGTSSLAYEMLVILKAATAEQAQKAIDGIVDVVSQPDWKVKVQEKEVLGVEDPGLHMVFKKLTKLNNGFCLSLAKALDESALDIWIGLNRGCFLLVNLFENGSEEVQDVLKTKLKLLNKKLKKLDTTGAKILRKKLE